MALIYLFLTKLIAEKEVYILHNVIRSIIEFLAAQTKPKDKIIFDLPKPRDALLTLTRNRGKEGGGEDVTARQEY